MRLAHEQFDAFLVLIRFVIVLLLDLSNVLLVFVDDLVRNESSAIEWARWLLG